MNLLHFLKDCYKIAHLPFEETKELHKEIQKYKEKKHYVIHVEFIT